MGYFANGVEGIDYQEQWCVKCVHFENFGCPIWDAHSIGNYNDCNNPDSILHILIPRDKDGCNEKCRMFIAKENGE